MTSGNMIYVPSADHTVYALDARTGAIVWHYTTNGSLDSAPALDRGLLLVAGSDGTLYELNATTGAQAGLIALGTPDLGSSPLPLGANVIAPCSAGGVPSLCEFDLTSDEVDALCSLYVETEPVGSTELDQRQSKRPFWLTA